MRAVIVLMLIALTLWAREATMLPSTFALLENVQDMMGEKRYDEAAAKLESAAATLQKRPYDLAFVLHTRAYVALAIDRYGEAADYFKRALALNALPENTRLATLLTLAQLYLMERKTDEAIALLKSWEKAAKEPDPRGFLLLASAYLDKNDYLSAYEPLKKAVALSLEPPVSWVRTLAAVCVQLQKYDEAAAHYKNLVAHSEATRADWMGLFYVLVTQNKEAAALDALQAALADGAIEEENDLLTLSRMQLSKGVPIRAARLIEQAIKEGRLAQKPATYELYAHALRLAREHRAMLEALKTGAALEGGAKLYEPLAHGAYETGAYEACIQAAAKALAHTPKNPGTLWLLRGSAAYELKRYGDAREAFKEAQKHEKSRDQARRWLGYLRTL